MDTLSDRFKLKGTICTNELVLNLLAYDTTKERPKPRASSSRPPDDENDDDMESALLQLEEQEAESSSSRAHLRTCAKRKLSAAPPATVKHTSDTERARVSSINWKRGSKMLKNVSSSSGPTPLVVGMDPGEWHLRKTWDLRKAQKTAYDYGIDSIPQLAGGNNGRKMDSSNPAVFVIDLGSFNTQTALSSKRSEFEKRFITRARPLGYEVVGVHEYYTGAKCPRPNRNAFLEIHVNRSKYCRSCQIYCDRDMVGSENNARVCLSHITTQTRPNKFKSTSS
ncbi:hypothetical protein BCR41DRAFT_422862 [Lobosporangium transversale]|uniref:Uncharacterized protein n=1 Tax=Lobosporangium transversale TaxID=64571 RepID=A0A1Y2GLE9_9FUNG|nr:hypothetical protein BCR41DRAFT_422862 [Lobosporangium transversale]ORZ13344.1 hypothetical protein BCR41DRAFT_422862 [Lobosporangium transversale]|eukprot:XP_021880425.1 hypothetical protein BCR41DRAFT_422862 [Lobosporangium transversale]